MGQRSTFEDGKCYDRRESPFQKINDKIEQSL